jgi:hypothetical protein
LLSSAPLTVTAQPTKKFRDVSTNLVGVPVYFGGIAGKLYNEIMDIPALAPRRSRTVPKSRFPHHIIYGRNSEGFGKFSRRFNGKLRMAGYECGGLAAGRAALPVMARDGTGLPVCC